MENIMKEKTKKLIIKIVKGIIFVFFILAFLPQIFSALAILYDFPAFALGSLLGYGLPLSFVYYLLYKCQYKWIKKVFKKH